MSEAQHRSHRVDCPPIYMDAALFETTKLTGITRYTARLAMALGAAGAPVRFFVGGEQLALPANLNWSQDQDPGQWARRIWRCWREPMECPTDDSVAVYTASRPAHKAFPREVSVLHDFTPLLLPSTHTAMTNHTFNVFFSLCLPLSDLILADSHSTKADAAWLADVDPAKISVAYPGPSQCVHNHLHSRKVERRPNIGLVVSTLEPRKNAQFLIDWFRNTDVLPPKAELWWAGGIGWLFTKKQLKDLSVARDGRRIRFLGYVTDKQLCKLYQTAGWSVYPSLYEGFGLPVLDALRHGTPVLTSENSSLREFAGPGVHFFDPCETATVDVAYRNYQEAGPVSILKGSLDRLYSWESIADTIISFARGTPVKATVSAIPRPHLDLSRRAQSVQV